jgi:SAM-dependent methyltransferase
MFAYPHQQSCPVTEQGYRPAEYWSQLLESDFSLRGTGHICYSRGYNVWMYRGLQRVFRRALGGVPLPARALDIGSGVGWVVNELVQWGATVSGCDITDVSVRRLSERFPKVSFSRVALGSDPLPHPDASFDLVTILAVTFHIVDDALWRSGVGEIARVLRPGGRLIVTDGFGERDVVPWEHVRFRSKPRWLEAAAETGLRLESLRPCYRWLSRDLKELWLPALPGRVRGAMEYGLEIVAPRRPHMRCAVFVRS